MQKPKDLEKMEAVTKKIQKALKKEREVEFFAFVKMLSATEYAVVIECALQRKSKIRMRHWRKNHYEEQEVPSFSYTVQIDSWFRVSCKIIIICHR
jgi:predicted choloylglycine hydrolase